MLRCALALRSPFQNGMVVEWYRRSTACESNMSALCTSNGKENDLNPWQHGMGMKWEQHGMCELALKNT
jgi:hypothetical protein